MPCDSEYLGANYRERELSKVACLLGELRGLPIDPDHWSGYHPEVYSKNVDGDKMVAELCEKLQSVDVTQYSLEMQMWWRDHQKADKDRIEKGMQSLREDSQRQAAIAKLTPYERQLLGL